MALQDLSIPIIDRNVEHVGVASLRKLDGKRLREFDNKMLVIQDHNTPLAVLLSYEKYLIIQDQLSAVMDTLELLNDSAEVKALIAGLSEAGNGNARSIDEIRKELKRGK